MGRENGWKRSRRKRSKERRSLMRKNSGLSAGFALLALLVSGCGYTAGTLLPPHLKTVHIPLFKENFAVPGESGDIRRFEPILPGVGSDVTQEVVARFFLEGSLQIVDREDADAILSGEVIGFRRTPLSYTSDDEVREYRVTILVNVTFRDLKKDEIVWEVKNFAGEATYLATESEDEAVKEAVEDLARRLVNRAVEVW